MKFKSSSAFTLIELLVVISIIGIIFTLGVAGYRDFSRRQALTGVSKQLKADIRLAQQLALTGQKPSDASCNTLISYSFSRTGSTGYTIGANCLDAIGNSLSPRIVKTVNLTTSNVSISSTASSVTFKTIGQGTDLSGSNTITLTHTSGNTALIIVGVNGDVK